MLNSTTAPDYGRYQVLVNGVKIGNPLDFYSEKVANTEFQLMDFWPDPGKYTVRLECVGKKPEIRGFRAGVGERQSAQAPSAGGGIRLRQE